MPRRGATLVAVVVALALVAALLPGTALAAFSVPSRPYVVLAGERVEAPVVTVALAHDQTTPAPLDTRGPPRA